MEEETSRVSESQMKQDYGIVLNRISLPSFTGVSLEGIVNQVERLNVLERGCENLLKLFMNSIQREGETDSESPLKWRTSNIKKTFRWDSERFTANSVDKTIILLDKEYSRVNKVYNDKIEEFSRIKIEYEKLQKLTRGNLCDINLNIVVDSPEKYEFLSVLYVVVNREQINEFNAMIEESAHVSMDAVEKISSDEEYVLFKMYVLQHSENEVKNAINASGFMLRTLDEDGIASAEMTSMRRKVEEKYSNAEGGLVTFIHIHLIETLKITIHVKFLRLFVESVYRYGLPTEYVFFVSWGEKSKVLKQWTMIARDWPSDRMICDEEGENDENDIFFAFSEVDVCHERT